MSWDVVIIGGGGAALCAALSAAETGTRVLVISKTKLGLGNCTAVAGGGFTVGVGGFSPDKHQRKTRETGRWVNDSKLVEILAAEGPNAVLGLQKHGVKLEVTPGLVSTVKYASREIVAGTAFTLPLVEAIRACPHIQVKERALVTEILTGTKGCLGLEYLDLNEGVIHQVAARSVVVATGGAGQLYARTDNPVRTTGDGYALLYRLGLTLKDMEFVQFFPLGFADEDLPAWFLPLTLIDEVPLTNSQGDEFLRAKLPEWGIKSGAAAERYARDRCAQAVAKEVASGRGAFLHLNQLPETAWKSGVITDLARIARRKIDLEREPVAVAPTQHFFCGGVIVGTEGETEIPGVFACGEVAAGVHGANRVGGNALTELVVFGLRAGKAAAVYAREATDEPVNMIASNTEARLKKWEQGQGMNPREFKRRLQRMASRHLGVLRTGNGLERALDELKELGSAVRELSAQNPKALQEAVEAENLYQTALMVAQAALLREESRGVHYREDFPLEDDRSWCCSIHLQLGEDGHPRAQKQIKTV
ncbi:MAG: FAD-dependent oxidoreductase [bacterium]|jgi:fumarate reductase (CoM/CoB) subunit A